MCKNGWRPGLCLKLHRGLTVLPGPPSCLGGIASWHSIRGRSFARRKERGGVVWRRVLVPPYLHCYCDHCLDLINLPNSPLNKTLSIILRSLITSSLHKNNVSRVCNNRDAFDNGCQKARTQRTNEIKNDQHSIQQTTAVKSHRACDTITWNTATAELLGQNSTTTTDVYRYYHRTVKLHQRLRSHNSVLQQHLRNLQLQQNNVHDSTKHTIPGNTHTIRVDCAMRTYRVCPKRCRCA